MPIIKSAQKKLRQDIRNREQNRIFREKYKHALVVLRRKAEKKLKLTEKDLAGAFTLIDKTAKRGIIHPNKAARLKSRVSKLVNPKA